MEERKLSLSSPPTGSEEAYWVFLERLAIALGGKALSFPLRGLGYSGALASAIAWSLRFSISESCNMMALSGASGSGSGEGARGRGFRWTDLFGDLFGRSSLANSEAGANQPAPDSLNPGEPAAPLEPEMYQPLLEDGQRRRELCDRLTINTIRSPLPEDTFHSIIATQFQTELKMKEVFCSDRVLEDSILEKRHEIRGVLFYPKGKPFSLDTYLKHLNQIENHGAHRSPPYKKLQTAIEKKALGLVFERIKKRKAWY
ncbi:hypothetical protein K7X08_006183 [Anisodus acutangulus]|uniref:Uncharacterized protein n=1 Tax=Anisodus acutangulus TaxID=402998 RepID=A0A9Q1RR70_9SOLA|nr:hypothetical protein K7X08_006183 [Anisodus acutangulus]